MPCSPKRAARQANMRPRCSAAAPQRFASRCGRSCPRRSRGCSRRCGAPAFLTDAPWLMRTADRYVAQNRRARHDYLIEDTIEAGVVLQGTEVKVLRQGQASITEAYADQNRGELYLVNANIPEY